MTRGSRDTTLYTTLAPVCHAGRNHCPVQNSRVAVGEARTFDGELELLRTRGVEVVVLDDQRSVHMMSSFQSDTPDLWVEDIAE